MAKSSKMLKYTDTATILQDLTAQMAEVLDRM